MMTKISIDLFIYLITYLKLTNLQKYSIYTDEASVKKVKCFTKYMCFEKFFALYNTSLNGF